MGYLTTFTVYNDELSELENNAVEVVKDIIGHAAGGIRYSGRFIGHGGPIIAQDPIHASSTTFYISKGNTVSELNSFSKDTIDTAKNHPDIFNSMIREMEIELKRLKKLQTDIENYR